jgi:hypothetical protein
LVLLHVSPPSPLRCECSNLSTIPELSQANRSLQQDRIKLGGTPSPDTPAARFPEPHAPLLGLLFCGDAMP